MNKKQRIRAQKVFETWLSSDNDGEIDAAYEALCRAGATLKDVAHHASGTKWRTIINGVPFDLTDDFPLLA